MIEHKKSCMLAPNEEISPEDISYPIFVSRKLDGVRCIVFGDKMYSRNWKLLSNALHNKFKSFLTMAKSFNMVFDGEVFSPQVKFNELMGLIKPSATKVPDHVGLYVFDSMTINEWETRCPRPFVSRFQGYESKVKHFKNDNVQPVAQIQVETPISLEHQLEYSLNEGYEGLIVKSINGEYKHGRATLKEGLIYKFKEWQTDDAQIIGFMRATQMKEDYKSGDTRELDNMGYLKRSSKQDNREEINAVGALLVRLKSGVEVGVKYAKGTNLHKVITWDNKNSFLNKWVEISFMAHGSKDKPRFPRITRLRPDLD